MKLDAEFIKLPITFDVARLVEEVNQVDPGAWQPHPGKHPGNTALPLISFRGESNDDFHGRMEETPHLRASEYIRQVFATFGEVFGRSRLMRLAGGTEVPEHVDANYHWHRSVRIHVPIITNDQVMFHCGDECINMKAGECWVFDSWLKHRVVNHSDQDRIHLVLDTAGSSRFWDILDQSLAHFRQQGDYPPPQMVPYVPGKPAEIMVERYNLTPILAPGEVDGLVDDIIIEMKANTANQPQHMAAIAKQMQRFCKDWRMLFSVFGYQKEGMPRYIRLIKDNEAVLRQMPFDAVLEVNGQSAKTVFFARVFSAAVSPAVRQDHVMALAD
jgi:hypothetical protein